MMTSLTDTRAACVQVIWTWYPIQQQGYLSKEIDPQSELLYKSHVNKIEKMKAWKDSPFREMRVEKKSTAFALKPLSTSKDKLFLLQYRTCQQTMQEVIVQEVLPSG
jgi:hypothetical protein